ncbi:hypothetical protein QVD17_15705 [Tagetes erecta]|uniref:Reverse transcriptase zinc-binding domain-containing protein n=1 Tax=Tagetes erecta TaxID=13708 RepID=A0AAD8NYU7_TARER|nr:hypothetical protein QVD17_15705 [Tagetes erecta]
MIYFVFIILRRSYKTSVWVKVYNNRFCSDIYIYFFGKWDVYLLRFKGSCFSQDFLIATHVSIIILISPGLVTKNLPRLTERSATDTKADPSTTFNTKEIHQEIEDLCLPVDHRVFHDSKLVPSKVNIFVWSALINGIQTKEALHHRNIIPNPICPSCEKNESPEHVFLNCERALKVWHAIFKWCNIPINQTVTIGQLLKIPASLSVTSNTKKLLYAIILTSLWCIWRARNDHIFNAKTKDTTAIIEDIKSLAHLWTKSKGSFKNLRWRI